MVQAYVSTVRLVDSKVTLAPLDVKIALLENMRIITVLTHVNYVLLGHILVNGTRLNVSPALLEPVTQ
jgi:hypothetical protein